MSTTPDELRLALVRRGRSIPPAWLKIGVALTLIALAAGGTAVVVAAVDVVVAEDRQARAKR